jgi:hypothetical protein
MPNGKQASDIAMMPLRRARRPAPDGWARCCKSRKRAVLFLKKKNQKDFFKLGHGRLKLPALA